MGLGSRLVANEGDTNITQGGFSSMLRASNLVKADPEISVTESKKTISPDAVMEAERILHKAEEGNITLRLLGGIAFRLSSPSSTNQNFRRDYVDIDFVGLRKESVEIQKFFEDLGYVPRRAFNALYSHDRLFYYDTEHNRRVDIFLDKLSMCHELDFRDRLGLRPKTLPLADLLLTKLQVYEITEREYKDVTALLKDKEFLNSDSDQDKINTKYIAKLCSNDWGLWRTVTLNLERIQTALPQLLPITSEREPVQNKIEELSRIINNEPKLLRWKIRNKVGDKVKWYELPVA